MIRKLFYIFLLFIVAMPVFAEKIPVKVAPVQIISTHHDELEVGDKLEFEVVKDVYKDEKLFIKKGTNLIGVVDFVHPNGWFGDGANIKLLNFSTTDVNNKNIEISYPLNIKGGMVRSETKQYWIRNIATTFTWLGVLIRGSEIFVEPDTKIYNIFIEQ